MIFSLKDKVAILPDPEEEMDGGLFLPEQARQKAQTGVVIAVNGDDDMKVGDRVAFPKVVGIPIELENKTYILAKVTEVYAIIEDDE